MNILMIAKYPPIQGGVSRDNYWLSRRFVEKGHQVTVVTNAAEVEQPYRIKLSSSKDEDSLNWNGKIRVISTALDTQHFYIPKANPYHSKLCGLTLAEIEENQPDFIWASYLEPFGVAALTVSSLTGVPYVIRHAGSDIGRLMGTKQLYPIYRKVFEQAKYVITSDAFIGSFLSLGIPYRKLVVLPFSYLHPDYFKPLPLTQSSTYTLGIYGKVGRAKGSNVLIEAVNILKNKGEQVLIRAHWGGNNLSEIQLEIDNLGLESYFDIQPFIPHWEIPKFIHSCDVMLFLENNFGIKFHTPGIPKEILACGRPLITTYEVANKPIYQEHLNHLINCYILQNPNDPEDLARAIIALKDKSLREKLSQPQLYFDAQKAYEMVGRSIENLTQKIKSDPVNVHYEDYRNQVRASLETLYPFTFTTLNHAQSRSVGTYINSLPKNVSELNLIETFYAKFYSSKRTATVLKDCLRFEYYLAKTRLLVFPDEVFVNINNQSQTKDIHEISFQSLITLGPSVFFDTFSYDVTEVFDLTNPDWKNIKRIPTYLIVYRPSKANTRVLKVSSSVLDLLTCCSAGVTTKDLCEKFPLQQEKLLPLLSSFVSRRILEVN